MMAMTTSNSMSVNAFLGMTSPRGDGLHGCKLQCQCEKTSESACNSTLGGYDVTRDGKLIGVVRRSTSSQAPGKRRVRRERGENA